MATRKGASSQKSSSRKSSSRKSSSQKASSKSKAGTLAKKSLATATSGAKQSPTRKSAAKVKADLSTRQPRGKSEASRPTKKPSDKSTAGQPVNDTERRLRELEATLRRHSHLYYVKNAPEISDREFDRLFAELQELEAAHPELVHEDSPTRYVGSDLDNDFVKVRHSIPVLSLANTYSPDEALQWAAKLAGENEQTQFIIEWKIDGATLVLYYEKGRLTRAVTRGSGQVGDDVTANARTIRSIPHLLTRPLDLAVRGEVYMTFEDFERFNESEGNLYANPRNLAAGTLKHKKSRLVAARPLRWTAFDLVLPAEPGRKDAGKKQARPRTDGEAMALAGELGLPVQADTIVVPFSQLAKTIAALEARRDEVGIPVDGLVIKLDSLEARIDLGFTATTPRWATALKFEPESGTTTVKDIELVTGRTGRVTPRAALEPVQLAGTTVSFATLHNADYIEKLDVRIGSKVRVSKRGEIIPAVEEVLERGKGKPFRFPSKCPSCGSKLVRPDEAVDWLCPNAQCTEKLINALVFFCARKQMDIAGLGEKVIRILFEQGFIRYPEDIYQLHKKRAELEQLEGFGERSVGLLLDGIEKSKSREFRFVLPALGLRDVGPNLTELLLQEGYRDINALLALAKDKQALPTLEAIDGIGPRTAQLFVEQFTRKDVQERIAALRRAGLQFSAPEEEGAAQSDEFAGQVWCVTGTFEHFKPRDLALTEVRNRGGKTTGSVSSKTTHLLAGESAGSKLEKARKLGVTIVTEAEFLKLL